MGNQSACPPSTHEQPRRQTLRPPKVDAVKLDRDMDTLLNKTGILTDERRAQLDRAAAAGAEKDRAHHGMKLRRASNVWPRFAEADIDNLEFVRRNFPECLEDYCNVSTRLQALLDFPGIIIMRGGNGSGKSHLASALVNKFCALGREAYFTTADMLYDRLKSCFGAQGHTVCDLLDRLRRYDLLVIDEIENRVGSAWEDMKLRALVDARYASFKSTVIITNKTLEEVQEYFSPAIRDRVCESGGVVNCDWNSFRQVNHG